MVNKIMFSNTSQYLKNKNNNHQLSYEKLKKSITNWRFEAWLKITLKITPYDARNLQQLFRVEKMSHDTQNF